MKWTRLVSQPTISAVGILWMFGTSAHAQGMATCDDAWCHDDNPCTLDQCSLTLDGLRCDNPYDEAMEGIACEGHGWAVYCSGEGVCGAAFGIGMPHSCPEDWCDDGNPSTTDVCTLTDRIGGSTCSHSPIEEETDSEPPTEADDSEETVDTADTADTGMTEPAETVGACPSDWCDDGNPCTQDQCARLADGGTLCTSDFDDAMEGEACVGHEWAVYCSGDGVCGGEFGIGEDNSCPDHWCEDGDPTTDDICILTDRFGGSVCSDCATEKDCAGVCGGTAEYDVCGVCEGSNDCCDTIPVPNGVCAECSDTETCSSVRCDAGYTTTSDRMGCVSTCPVATDETIRGFVSACLGYSADGDCYDLYGCTINEWDVSAVTDTRALFEGATAFNQPLGDWDMSGVHTMRFMFAGASAFNQDLDAWDVSNTTNMTAMFQGAASFNQDLPSWDVSDVRWMQWMFQNATAFNGDVTTWDVSSARTVAYMFMNLPDFNQDISGWRLSNAYRTNAMFSGAASFDQDLSDWDVSGVEWMHNMFQDAISFDGDLSGWDVSTVHTAHHMFYGAVSFDGDIRGWDTSSMSDTDSMFADAASFTGDLSCWTLPDDTDIDDMFSGSYEGACEVTKNAGGIEIDCVAGGSCTACDTFGTCTARDCDDDYMPSADEATCEPRPLEGFHTTWVYQQGTNEQYTRCYAVSDDGNTCLRPDIRYGTTTGGVPYQIATNDYEQWCQQLGFEGFSGDVTYGARGCDDGGRVFWCDEFDEAGPHWCDWQDGHWRNDELNQPECGSEAVLSITCVP